MTTPDTHRARDDDAPLPWGEIALMVITLSAVAWLGIAALVEWLF